MQVLFLTFLGVCSLSLASAGDGQVENLALGAPSGHVELDDHPYTPVYLPELSEDDCLRFPVEDAMDKFMSDDNKHPAKQQLRLRFVQFCKESLEKDLTKDLAKINDQVKERVNLLVENLDKVNGNSGFTGREFHMQEGLVQEGILKALEQSGTDLSSIKTVEEFNSIAGHLLKDCKEVIRNLHNFAYVYRLYLNRDFVQPDQSAAQWVKNTYVCRFLDYDYQPHGNGAYDLLRSKYPVKSE